MNNQFDSHWSMDYLTNINSTISHYEANEQSPMVGGQGVCKKGRATVHLEDGNKLVQDVAIKQLTYAFCSAHDAKYAYRELVLLSLVRHPNLISLLDVLVPSTNEFPLDSENLCKNITNFTQLFLVTKYGGDTLSSQMRRRNLLKQRWTLREIAGIIFQVLLGLDYLHNAGIVHRDLKTNNIVINSNGQIKILDFGCGRYVNAGSKMTPDIMVPFYRPPEIFLGINSYNTKVDIWSVGCIFAELLLGRRLFNGTDFERQWPKFIQVLGTPNLDECFNGAMGQIRPSYLEFIQKLGRIEIRQENWKFLLPDELFLTEPNGEELNAKNARDLLSKMLQFDSTKRISAAEALRHPLFAKLSKETFCEQSNADEKIDYNFEDELNVHLVDQWKERILQQIEKFALSNAKKSEN